MADPREEGLIYLDGLIERLRSRAETVNSFWLKSIGKRLRELKKLDPSDAAGIAAIRNDRELIADIVDMIQNVGQDTVEDARNVLRAAARLSMDASPVAQDLAMEEWINGIAEASAGTLRNLSNTTTVGVWTPSGFQTPGDAYITAIDQISAQMASGKYGLNTAVRKVLKQFADSGLSVVEYESGHTRSLGAAVEMNLKEATSQVYQGVQRRIGQEFGADGVEISAHWDCAPDHLPVQGRQYTHAQYEKINASLDRPIGTLNCRHTIYSIIIGVSEPTYSEAELEAMRKASLRKKEFDGKEMTNYEASQVQRRLEREIRKQKNRSVIAASAGDDEMRREAQMKINQLTGKYKDLSDAFGIKTKAERMQVSGFRSVSVEKEKKNHKVKNVLPDKIIPDNVRPYFTSQFEEEVVSEALRGGAFSELITISEKMTDKQLNKSIRSYQKQIDKHIDKINHPEKYASEYNNKREEEKKGLLKHWEDDIKKNRKSLIISQRERNKRDGKR